MTYCYLLLGKYLLWVMCYKMFILIQLGLWVLLLLNACEKSTHKCLLDHSTLSLTIHNKRWSKNGIVIPKYIKEWLYIILDKWLSSYKKITKEENKILIALAIYENIGSCPKYKLLSKRRTIWANKEEIEYCTEKKWCKQ